MEAFVVNAMEYLYDNGYDITLVCTMENTFISRHKGRFKCVNILMKRGSDFCGAIKAIWTLFRLFREERYDMIQYATPNAAFYASIASWVARVPARIYCQWGIRYIGFKGLKRFIFKFLERFICSLSTHIRPASQKNLKFAVSEKLFRPGKASLVGNGGTIGVDFSVININQKVKWRKEIRDKLSINDKTIFGFVGSIRPDKGCNELLKAFSTLSEQNDDVGLILLGDELASDPIEKKLREWAYHSEFVRFCGFTKDVWRYMAAMDVLVHPSHREGFSMVIQEAAALAIPVITTDIPGPSEVIENGKTGILVPVNNTEELLIAMEKLLKNKKLRDKLGYAGLLRTRRLFKRELMLQYILDDRNSICGEKSWH